MKLDYSGVKLPGSSTVFWFCLLNKGRTSSLLLQTSEGVDGTMKWLLAVFSFASFCGLLFAAADVPDESELTDDIRQRETRRFDGGQSFNPFFEQGLHSRQGNTMINWNSLLSKKKRDILRGPGEHFGYGFGRNNLQDWSSTFGRVGRAFAAPGDGYASLGVPVGGGSLDEDGMQNWRAFFSRHSRKKRSTRNINNESWRVVRIC